MRVLILTQYYPPDSPGQIPRDIARELSRRGHDVKVLTAFPHYDSGRIPDGYKQRLHHTEVDEGIPVRRVPIYPSHSSNPVGRIANYMSFALSARLARDFVADADVIYVHGTPATVAEPANYWSRKLGIPFVYHVQDIWPESVTASGFLPKPLSEAAGALISRRLKTIYSSAAAVTAISPTAMRLLVQRGVSQEKCHLVFNWSSEHSNDVRDQASTPPGLTLLYAGNLGPFQDLETVIRAVHRVGKLPGIRLLIAGAGTEERSLRRLVEELQATNIIQFLGKLPQEKMGGLYRRADFQIVSLRDVDIFAGTIPSKFQLGLAHGIPVITTVKGDVTTLVQRHNLGFAAPPEDVEELARVIAEAYVTTAEERQQFSRRAKDFYESNFAREQALDRIENTLRTVVYSRPVEQYA